MFTIEKLQLKTMPSQVGWYVKISTLEELSWWSTYRNKGFAESILGNYVRVRNGCNHVGHLSRIANAIRLKGIDAEDSFGDSLDDFIAHVVSNQWKLISTGYNIYVHPVGFGFTFDTEEYNTYNLLESKENENLFASEFGVEVRYLQWEDGNHWYVKIGVIDVCDKENQYKWDTKEEAEQALFWYINEFPSYLGLKY